MALGRIAIHQGKSFLPVLELGTDVQRAKNMFFFSNWGILQKAILVGVTSIAADIKAKFLNLKLNDKDCKENNR